MSLVWGFDSCSCTAIIQHNTAIALVPGRILFNVHSFLASLKIKKIKKTLLQFSRFNTWIVSEKFSEGEFIYNWTWSLNIASEIKAARRAYSSWQKEFLGFDRQWSEVVGFYSCVTTLRSQHMPQSLWLWCHCSTFGAYDLLITECLHVSQNTLFY